MITTLKEWKKFKLNESNSSDYTLEDYFRDKKISLEKQKELTSLFCHNEQLTSLKGIENCINLEWLYCSNNQLTSLNGIENLSKLNYLYCDDIIDIQQYKIENINIYL
jgi:Leucine-rich repeat (LRR) protein